VNVSNSSHRRVRRLPNSVARGNPKEPIPGGLRVSGILPFKPRTSKAVEPSVAEAAAVGVPSEDGEQEIKAFVVPGEPVVLAALATGRPRACLNF
jgi:hypothetical protein